MLDIKITKTTAPKEKPKGNLGFGRIFTDHMFVMDYTQGVGWHDPRIVPYQDLTLSPAAMVFWGSMPRTLQSEYSAVPLSQPFLLISMLSTFENVSSMPLSLCRRARISGRTLSGMNIILIFSGSACVSFKYAERLSVNV